MSIDLKIRISDQKRRYLWRYCRFSHRPIYLNQIKYFAGCECSRAHHAVPLISDHRDFARKARSSAAYSTGDFLYLLSGRRDVPNSGPGLRPENSGPGADCLETGSLMKTGQVSCIGGSIQRGNRARSLLQRHEVAVHRLRPVRASVR